MPEPRVLTNVSKRLVLIVVSLCGLFSVIAVLVAGSTKFNLTEAGKVSESEVAPETLPKFDSSSQMDAHPHATNSSSRVLEIAALSDDIKISLMSQFSERQRKSAPQHYDRGMYLTAGNALWSINQDQLCSGDGNTRAVMQTDGNFVIYRRLGQGPNSACNWSPNTGSINGEVVVFATNTYSSATTILLLTYPSTLQLIEYTTQHVLWQATTSNTNPAYLEVHDEGFISLDPATSGISVPVLQKGIYWMTGGGEYLLGTNSYLEANGALVSSNNQYMLRMQSDCNLVVYNGLGSSQPVWASNTAGSTHCTAKMQTDGNFVVYDGTTVKWSSNTYNYAPSSLFVKMQTDGSMALLISNEQVYFSTAPVDNHQWMRRLPNNALIRDLIIPGTHDSGTATLGSYGLGKDQGWNVWDQLNNGVRYFDIRLSRCLAGQSALCIWHGTSIIPDNGFWNSFSTAFLDPVCNYLSQYGSETILFQVQLESPHTWSQGGPAEFQSDVESYLNNPACHSRFYQPPSGKTSDQVLLGDVRGMIVLFYQNFDHQSAYGFVSNTQPQSGLTSRRSASVNPNLHNYADMWEIPLVDAEANVQYMYNHATTWSAISLIETDGYNCYSSSANWDIIWGSYYFSEGGCSGTPSMNDYVQGILYSPAAYHSGSDTRGIFTFNFIDKYQGITQQLIYKCYRRVFSTLRIPVAANEIHEPVIFG